MIIWVIPPQGCTQSARSKSEAYGTFGSNWSGLNADLFLRKIMKKKRARKKKKKSITHSSWSLLSYIWWLLKRSRLFKWLLSGRSLLATSPLILVSPRLVSCAPWAFARLACSAHGRMRPLKELNQTLLSAPCLCKRWGLHSHLDSANSPNEQKTLFCALKEQSRQACRAATDKSWRFWKCLTTIRQALWLQAREWAQKTSSLARDLARKEVIGIHRHGNGRTSHDAGC